MSDSDSSPLSSIVSTDEETLKASVKRGVGLEKYFKRAAKPPKLPKRLPPPPHEDHELTLADNPDIAVIVMFRERFSDVFPKNLPHYGPQEIEMGVTDIVPGDHIERLLCALIGLVLNRKKDVERGHYQRALEEAVQTHTAEWPRSWEGKNPLHGGKTFASMNPTERLGLLKTFILWALQSSEAVQNVLKDGYKPTLHGRERNSALDVQTWGQDTWKRRFFLIEGQDDTHFRLYRQSKLELKTDTWWSLAGTIDELKAVAGSLAEEKPRSAKDLSKKLFESVPRFEGSEEKRRRRDYRLARKAQFVRPEPGVSLYEGRTRGKRIKYTFSDEEDDSSSDIGPSRRSTRNQSRITTPAEPSGPIYTASGRQVRSRIGGAYGETMLTGRQTEIQGNGTEAHEGSRRTRSNMGPNGYAQGGEGYNSDDMDDALDPASSGDQFNSADEPNFGDEDEASEHSIDEEDMNIRPSLVVQLRYGKGKQIPKETAYPSPSPGPKGDPAVLETLQTPAQAPDITEAPQAQPIVHAAPNGLGNSPVDPNPFAQSTVPPASETTPLHTQVRAEPMDIDSKDSVPSAATQVGPVQPTPFGQQDTKVEQNSVV